jgi:2-keto-4-pentenoate hydratase/2-oxohepta-3-ene-1,7-dioic acid hydratase in catechol pathway
VPADELDPSALGIRAHLNGELMQESTTAKMIFGVDDLVAFIGEAITLAPGDLIATGTPEGVGAFRDPPVFLQPGDEIAVEIDGIGRLANRVVRSVDL